MTRVNGPILKIGRGMKHSQFFRALLALALSLEKMSGARVDVFLYERKFIPKVSGAHFRAHKELLITSTPTLFLKVMVVVHALENKYAQFYTF